jgi:hypothetical protein
MTDLPLPDRLKGRWDHLLILTYGADLPFFETAVWRQIDGRCRNRIILANGKTFLNTCADLAERPEAVIHLNRHYVADGIFGPPAAHAKLVLLTTAERGRLLVGSGNLGWQGFASGGELFAEYGFSPQEENDLGAFVAVRELLDILIDRSMIGQTSIRHVRYLLEQTPWLYRPAPDGKRPVRHNVGQSFLDQFRDVIAGQEVEELWILSPFYDQRAEGLRRLLTELNPRQTSLLVQDGRTSADADALRRVLEAFPNQYRVLSVRRPEESHLHAKFYLVKLADRAVCLQGSPNLSQVAMVRPMGPGNLEIANLLVDRRNAFDHVVDELVVVKHDTSIGEIDLRFQGGDGRQEAGTPAYLTGAEWSQDGLRLDFRGALPELGVAEVIIAGEPFPVDIVRRAPGSLIVSLPLAATELLTRPCSVFLRWTSDSGEEQTNPVFVCDRFALDAMLQSDDRDDLFRRTGDLSLEDEEFERFFRELLDVLVIDRQSMWQLGGRSPTSDGSDGDAGERINYDDIDFEMLRRHPRLQQYRSRHSGQGHDLRTGLQAILSAITDRFNRPTRAHVVGSPSDEEDILGEEAEPEPDEQPIHWSERNRRHRIVTNFLRRYLSGLRDGDYKRLVGPEVVTTNAAVLVHILLYLLRRKDWVQPDAVVDAFVDAGVILWQQDDGYFWQLTTEEQEMAARWLREHHGDAKLLGALVCMGRVAHLHEWDERERRIRDVARAVISRPMLEFGREVLEETWLVVSDLIPYGSPSPTQIVEELGRLLEFETRPGLLRRIEREHGYPAGSCQFGKDTVGARSGHGTRSVDSVQIRATSPVLEPDMAAMIVETWRDFESLPEYRVHQPSTGRALVYDGIEDEGWFRISASDVIDIMPIRQRPREWHETLRRLRAASLEADAGMLGPQMAG